MFNPKPRDDLEFRIPRQCIWLKLNGSWPLKSSSTYFGTFYRLWSWYVIISVGITILFQTAFLIHTFGDIIMTTENCCTTFMGALNFVRLLHMHLNQAKFKDIIEQFVNDIWIVKDTHPEIELECRKNMRTFRMMTILLACLILMYCILPFIEFFTADERDPEMPFPYKMLFPYDAHHGWRYIVTYLFTSYAGVCVVTTLFAEDSIFGFFVTYTCGQFRILHERIDAIMPQAYAACIKRVGVRSATDWDYQLEYVRQLNQIARMHNNLMVFARHLEHFFNPILLVNFMISSILICMVGFQLVTGKDMFIGDYVKFVVYISSSLGQLYILCWNGDMLIQYSTDTARHLYACDWEGGLMSKVQDPDANLLMEIDDKSIKRYHEKGRLQRCVHYPPTGKVFRKNLQFMIMCSQQPVKITALKFSTLSLQSFTAILSTSMSYFTLLQTVYLDNQGS